MDKHQRKFLLKIKKSGLLRYSAVLPEEKTLIAYFKKENLIIQRGLPNEKEVFYEISQHGLSQLHIMHQTDFRFWFPIALSNLISVAALIISIIALLKK